MTRTLIYRPSLKPSVPVIVPVRSTGYYSVDEKHKEVPRIKDFIQLYWCVRGKGRFIIDGQEYFLEPEHCCMYFPGDCHQPSAASDAWEYYWMTIDPEKPELLIRGMNLMKTPFYAGRCPENLFLELQNELKDFSPSGQYRASVTGYDIMIRAVSGGYRMQSNGLVEEFKALVEKYSNRPDTSITDLAEMLDVHRSTLNRIFQEETGMSPGTYLNSFRIQEALTLLKGTAMRIGEISDKTGFSDPNYFSKAIKKATGFTPGEFRKR